MSQNIVSPLFAAARDGKTDLMAVLLDHSYDVNKQEANGWTPVASGKTNSMCSRFTLV
jgi:hypothetical protein